MKPKLFLDFDETLFDHGAYLRWIDEVWQRLYGMRPGMFRHTIDDFHTSIDDKHRLYRHREHYALSGKDWREVSAQLSQLITKERKDFCYPETHGVLRKLAHDGYKPSILTFGDAEYQQYKISHCSVLAELALPVQVVREPKRAFLAREFADQSGILVDDKHPLGLPAHWTHIWIDRSSELSKPLRHDTSTWQVSSLEQIDQLLQVV